MGDVGVGCVIEQQPDQFDVACPDGVVQCRGAGVVAGVGIEAGGEDDLGGSNVAGAHSLAQVRRQTEEQPEDEARSHPLLS